MSAKGQREIAARLMKVGYNRVWIDPDKVEDVANAITRKEIKRLIKDGVIKTRSIKGVSRGRARILHEKRKKSRRRGPGSREGSKNARFPQRKRWIQNIRSMRRKLRELVESKAITSQTRRKLYMQAKGGTFKSVPHLLKHIESLGLYRRKPK